jgi:hypothetical protein
MNEKWLIALLPIVAGLLAIVPVIKADDVNVTATVPPYVSVVFNYNTVNFGSVAPGRTDVPAPGQENGIYNVSVIANVPVSIYASRTAWSPSDVLTLKFAADILPPTSPQVELKTTSQLVTMIGYTGQYTTYHGYWLTVPSNARGGYSTTVTITYQPA